MFEPVMSEFDDYSDFADCPDRDKTAVVDLEDCSDLAKFSGFSADMDCGE